MKSVFFLFLLTLSSSLFAQQVQKCHTDEYVHHLNEQHPGLKDQIRQSFDMAKAHAQAKGQQKALGNWDTILRMPVVFHVVYNTPQENLSDALLMSQLDVLNEDFRRLNADTSNTRALFQGRAGDAGFEFFLATLDPDGNPTNGITRTQSNVATFNFFNIDDIKSSTSGGADGWDHNEYLNIWVGDFGGAVLGFAYPPVIAPNWPANSTPTDESVWGVALHYEIVGKNNPLATGQLAVADQGRSAVHEMGHFLGLRHIWGDSGFFGSIDCDVTMDDGISDTPHAGNNSQQTGCDFSKNTCVFESPDEPDMVENYMDYSTDACQNTFTDGQIEIMRSMSELGRPGLAFILADDVFNIAVGDYIVVNGDTIIVASNTTYTIAAGDDVLFIHENNGFHYTSSANVSFSSGGEIEVTEDGEIVGANSSINNLTDKDVSVYPNPTNDILHIDINNADFTKLKLFSIDGKLLQEELITNKVLLLALSNYNPGLYFISFYNNDSLVGSKKISLIK